MSRVSLLNIEEIKLGREYVFFFTHINVNSLSRMHCIFRIASSFKSTLHLKWLLHCPMKYLRLGDIANVIGDSLEHYLLRFFFLAINSWVFSSLQNSVSLLGNPCAKHLHFVQIEILKFWLANVCLVLDIAR